MPSSDSESIVLAEWADKECRHLDLIASWEVLLGSYEFLGFTDELTDEQRLSEFKTIIGEMNKFLTRMRNGLMSAKSIEDAVMFLAGHANTRDMGDVNTRPTVAYNKLKQRWIGQSISILTNALQRVPTDEGERDDD